MSKENLIAETIVKLMRIGIDAQNAGLQAQVDPKDLLLLCDDLITCKVTALVATHNVPELEK